jgi:thioredoxin-like negative regulator of GroEL
VYVDIERVKGANDRLKVISIPATIVLWDGRQVARLEGLVPHDSYESWLEAVHAQATSAVPFVPRAGEQGPANSGKVQALVPSTTAPPKVPASSDPPR